jgi:polyisoprenyl-phosphate glycosyltransferase
MGEIVTVVVPCFNERDNIAELYRRLCEVQHSSAVALDFLFVDNRSNDGTRDELARLAATDERVRVIVHQRNFGHVRSPFYGLLQAQGRAAVVFPADMQVQPEIITAFIREWTNGHSVVLAQRTNSQEGLAFRLLRQCYYRVVRRFAEIELLENTPGWGLYDRRVIEILRQLEDPYPYVRGLVTELGFDVATVPYEEVNRVRGISKNNFYTLFDVAMLAVTSHSKVPLRLATMLGFALAMFFGLSGLGYFVYKLVFWDRFPVGMAPVVIGLFFFASVQLFFIGVIGEYIGAIYTKVTKRPLVVEKERINFPPQNPT